MSKTRFFVRLYRDVLNSEAWQTLPPSAGFILIDIMGRHDGRNNGRIVYTVNDAQRCARCGRRQAIRCLKELEEKGFIVAVRRGHFQVKCGAWKTRGTTWRLTMEDCKGQPATRDYLHWRAAA